jgi:hypothetical protein
MPTIQIKDANNNTQTAGLYVPGRAPAADSAPVVLSAEDSAALTGLNTAVGAQADAAAADDTGPASMLGRIKRMTQRLSTLIAQLPASLGSKTAAASLSVTQDTDTTWRTRAFWPITGTGAALALTAATSSAAQAVATGTVIRFGNSGGAPITIEFGAAGVVATANSLVEILPGTSEAIMMPAGATHFAAFCASAATLKWITGTGA